MNAPSKFDAMPDWQATRLANIARFRKAVNEWVDAVALTSSRYSERVEFLELAALNAGISVWDDGNLSEARDNLCHDLGVDSEGWPLDLDGNQVEDAQFAYRAVLSDGSLEWRS